MNFASKDDFEKLEKRLADIQESVKGIKSNPIIQGYYGKRLDLNDNLNVVSLNARLAAIEARITALE
jgi:cell fate (sporulation/competence/biofilm development) regulator YmcA (YheA/YmcA/DUF963 family)